MPGCLACSTLKIYLVMLKLPSNQTNFGEWVNSCDRKVILAPVSMITLIPADRHLATASGTVALWAKNIFMKVKIL